MKRALLLSGCLLPLLALPLTAQPNTPPAERRQALIRSAAQGQQALPALRNALQDDTAVIRHTAVRLLAQIGEPAEADLTGALTHADPIVRRLALQALSFIKGNAVPFAVLDNASRDADDNVRFLAVTLLAREKPVTGDRLKRLTEVTLKEKNNAVREIASRATWPFYRNTVLLKNRADWDHEVTVAQDFPLPNDNWSFCLDPEANGHLKGWHKPDFDASAWKTIPVAATWESAGFTYDGVAWYRRSFTAPAKPEKFNAIELHFESVDECAWVWLNGVYIGQHDLGTAGWQIPFSLDVTKEIKWGEENLIIVRVLDTAGAGGIYKPVHLQVMQ